MRKIPQPILTSKREEMECVCVCGGGGGKATLALTQTGAAEGYTDHGRALLVLGLATMK